MNSVEFAAILVGELNSTEQKISIALVVCFCLFFWLSIKYLRPITIKSEIRLKCAKNSWINANIRQINEEEFFQNVIDINLDNDSPKTIWFYFVIDNCTTSDGISIKFCRCSFMGPIELYDQYSR